MTREEAIKEIRRMSLPKETMEILKALAPELAESEDERIRKEIVGVIQKHYPNTPESYRWISWLVKQKESLHVTETCKENTDSFTDDIIEVRSFQRGMEEGKRQEQEKQKEQKPHYTKRNALFDKCVENCDPEVMKKVSDEIDEMLKKEQKPAEWSEEDEKIIQSLILAVNKYVFFAGIETNKIVSFLKSLRPSWKPSDEQMQCLLAVITNQYNAGAESCHLTLGSLYNDLKKLI